MLEPSEVKNIDVTQEHLAGQITSLLKKIFGLEKTAAVQSQLKDALIASEKSLSAILEMNADGIVIVDTEGLILYVNPAAEKLFGKKEEDLLGYPFGFPVLSDESKDIIIRQGNTLVDVALRVAHVQWKQKPAFQLSLRDITERIQMQEEREKIIKELQAAMENIKMLSGLLPICSSCKKIRDDDGYWNQLEGYIQNHSIATFTHSVCPECFPKLYPEYAAMQKKNDEKNGEQNLSVQDNKDE
jgi:PAS domain-containing protein